MKLINPSVEQWHCGYTLPEIWSHIARCCRVCYQSEPRSNGETDEEFVRRVILRNHSFEEIGKNRELQLKLHLSVLEHGTVYLDIPYTCVYDEQYFYNHNKYSDWHYHDTEDGKSKFAITTNMRVIVEKGRMKDLDYICAPTGHHHLRTTMNIITDIGTARELDRHRSHSISEESTRYCSYNKEKFGKEITFIKPAWNIDDYTGSVFEIACKQAEDKYFKLLDEGWTPQQARQVLPLSTKVQTIHTAFNSDWEEFLKLRRDACSGSVHPNMRYIAEDIYRNLYGASAG